MGIFCSPLVLLSNHAVLYPAARVVLLKIKGDHFIFLLKTLHWHPIYLRIKMWPYIIWLPLTLPISPLRLHWPPGCSSNIPCDHSKHGPPQGPALPPAWSVLSQISQDVLLHAIQVLLHYHHLRVAFLPWSYKKGLCHSLATFLHSTHHHLVYYVFNFSLPPHSTEI